MGKLLESHALRQLAPRVRGRGRGAGAVRGGGVRRGGGPPARAASEQSCLWCAETGHNIFDCPSPPSPALKKVRDDLIAKCAAKGRNEDRKAGRLATAATSAIVSDDESDEGDDLAQSTYAAIQAYFTANEPTKSSCLRVLSQASLDPSPFSSLPLALRQKVVRRVSIAADSQACPVPSRCLLPAFVHAAKALLFQTSCNKHHKSSLLDAMELEFGFRRRSGNTPATQVSRLLQLQAYYAYEDY